MLHFLKVHTPKNLSQVTLALMSKCFVTDGVGRYRHIVKGALFASHQSWDVNFNVKRLLMYPAGCLRSA